MTTGRLEDTRVGVLGSGEVGRRLSAGFSSFGHDVMIGSRDPSKPELREWSAGEGAGAGGHDWRDELRNRPAPAALRAALYRTLALVPGIHLVGPTKDSVGRRGVAVTFTHDGLEDELIVDPDTATMLEERSIVSDPAKFPVGLPRGAIASRTTYLQRAVTNTIATP